jgi:hypothetical protein
MIRQNWKGNADSGIPKKSRRNKCHVKDEIEEING